MFTFGNFVQNYKKCTIFVLFIMSFFYAMNLIWKKIPIKIKNCALLWEVEGGELWPTFFTVDIVVVHTAMKWQNFSTFFLTLSLTLGTIKISKRDVHWKIVKNMSNISVYIYLYVCNLANSKPKQFLKKLTLVLNYSKRNF